MKKLGLSFGIIGALLAFSVSAVVAIPLLKEKNRQDARMFTEDLRGAAVLLKQLEELFKRHPDFDFKDAPERLSDFRELSDRAAVKRKHEFEQWVHELEQEMRNEIIGQQGEKVPGAGRYKTFSPNGFRDFFDSLSLEHTVPLPEPPAVTGHVQADRRIVRLAMDRGYRLRAEAEFDRLLGQDSYRLQPEALEAWTRMQREAENEGIRLGLISCYRSVDRQRRIFLDLLQEEARELLGGIVSPEEIAAGLADQAIESVLRESSVPGFSRHHSGYAMDIADLGSGQDYTEFGDTPGFAWLAEHNYLNAKRFGFIPSYPAGADKQGPDPEPWEYVWVGEDLLLR